MIWICQTMMDVPHFLAVFCWGKNGVQWGAMSFRTQGCFNPSTSKLLPQGRDPRFYILTRFQIMQCLELFFFFKLPISPFGLMICFHSGYLSVAWCSPISRQASPAKMGSLFDDEPLPKAKAEPAEHGMVIRLNHGKVCTQWLYDLCIYLYIYISNYIYIYIILYYINWWYY